MEQPLAEGKTRVTKITTHYATNQTVAKPECRFQFTMSQPFDVKLPVVCSSFPDCRRLVPSHSRHRLEVEVENAKRADINSLSIFHLFCGIRMTRFREGLLFWGSSRKDGSEGG